MDWLNKSLPIDSLWGCERDSELNCSISTLSLNESATLAVDTVTSRYLHLNEKMTIRRNEELISLNKLLQQDCLTFFNRNRELDTFINEQNKTNAALEAEIDYFDHLIEAMSVVSSRASVPPTSFAAENRVDEITLSKSILSFQSVSGSRNDDIPFDEQCIYKVHAGDDDIELDEQSNYKCHEGHMTDTSIATCTSTPKKFNDKEKSDSIGQTMRMVSKNLRKDLFTTKPPISINSFIESNEVVETFYRNGGVLASYASSNYLKIPNEAIADNDVCTIRCKIHVSRKNVDDYFEATKMKYNLLSPVMKYSTDREYEFQKPVKIILFTSLCGDADRIKVFVCICNQMVEVVRRLGNKDGLRHKPSRVTAKNTHTFIRDSEKMWFTLKKHCVQLYTYSLGEVYCLMEDDHSSKEAGVCGYGILASQSLRLVDETKPRELEFYLILCTLSDNYSPDYLKVC